jgi:glucose dehydrogenase
MTRTLARLVIFSGSVSCLLLVSTLLVSGQSSSGMVEWRSYGNDLRQTRYSPLDQINASNFN